MIELVTLVIKKEDSNMKKLELLTAVLASLLIFTMPAMAQWQFDGWEVKTMETGSIKGDIFVSHGNNSGLSAPPFTTYTDVPGGSAVWGRLYVGVWGGTQDRTGWVNTTLNGASLGNVTLGGTGDTNPTYSGGTNAYSSGNGVWWVSYNATNNVTMNAQNTATARTGGTIDGRVYAIVLALVYQNTSLPEVQYWINEGNVNLHYNSSAFPYVLDSNFTWFNGSAYSSTEARLNAVYLTGSSGEPDYLYFNPPSAGNSPYGNMAWDISAYRRYQLDGSDVADASNGSYFDFESFTSTNDSTALKDTVNTSANNYAIFWRGHDDNSDGWISAGFQVSGLEGEAYVHPVLAVLKLTNITHVYDFSTGAGVNKWAYRYQVGANPTANDPSTVFTAVQYANISVDDDLKVNDVTTTNGNYAAHRFNFSIAESAPEKINVTWIGRGYRGAVGGQDEGATLYIYNFTSGTYEQLASTTLDTEVTLTGEKTSSISSYINSGNATVLVKQNYPHGLQGASYIETDYVRLVVTP